MGAHRYTPRKNRYLLGAPIFTVVIFGLGMFNPLEETLRLTKEMSRNLICDWTFARRDAAIYIRMVIYSQKRV